jgi:thiamine pyrophosphate-dependent acetolactate synthase large subunit-like protein
MLHVRVYESHVSYPGRAGKRRHCHVTIVGDARDTTREIRQRIKRRMAILYNAAVSRVCKIENIRDTTSA